jgi:hypothetical protein
MKKSKISEGVVSGIKNWALRHGVGGRGRQIGAQLTHQQQITDRGYAIALKNFYLDGFKRAIGVTIDPTSTVTSCSFGGADTTPTAPSTPSGSTTSTDSSATDTSVDTTADTSGTSSAPSAASGATSTAPSGPTGTAAAARTPFRQKLAARNAGYYSGIKESIQTALEEKNSELSDFTDAIKKAIYAALSNESTAISESSVKTVSTGKLVVEAIDIYHITKILKEFDLTWNKIGLTVLEEDNRQYRIIGVDYLPYYQKFTLLEAGGRFSICDWFLATTKTLLAREKMPQLNSNYNTMICQYATGIQNTYQRTKKIDEKSVDAIVALIQDWREANAATQPSSRSRTPTYDLDTDQDGATEPAEVKSFKQQFMTALNRVPLDGSDNNAGLAKVLALYMSVLVKQDPDLFKKVDAIMKKLPTA